MLLLSAEDMGKILRDILVGEGPVSEESVRWVQDIRESLNRRASREPALAKNDTFIRLLQQAEARIRHEQAAAA